MRAASAELQAFLLSRTPFWTADLYTMQLTNGQTLYLTISDQPIVANGITYQAVGPQIKRGTWVVKYTQEVPTLTFMMYSTGVDFVDSVGNVLNIKQGAHEGLFDYAYIELDRAFMPTFGDVSLGTVLLFGGRTAGLQITALGIQFNAKGDNVLMQQYMPKNTFQLGCIHRLYDAGCTLVQSDFTITQGVGTGAANVIFLPWSAPPSTPANYVQGTVQITSGQGEGQIRSIVAADSTGISLVYPLYTLPAPGDLMAVSQGCPKTQAACASQFSNLAHYRGFPYIPPVETAT